MVWICLGLMLPRFWVAAETALAAADIIWESPSKSSSHRIQTLEIMADSAQSTPKSYSTDPNLYLYTSLTAGSSQIITATSRLETILKANRIPFQALDVATDEKARMLWGRRAGKRKLPGLVRMGMIVGVRISNHPLG